MDWQRGIQQEPEGANGKVPGQEHLRGSNGELGETSGQAWVRSNELSEGQIADPCRFMADKIMPLSEAVEGYDIFDKMKVQKVVFEAQK